MEIYASLGAAADAARLQAMFRAHGIRRTMVVTFDYSSLVLLELLRREQEPADASGTTIDAVFIVNGGLFADAHSHPWSTTPMLNTPLGGLYMQLAQRAAHLRPHAAQREALFQVIELDAQINRQPPDLADLIRPAYVDHQQILRSSQQFVQLVTPQDVGLGGRHAGWACVGCGNFTGRDLRARRL